MGRQRSAAAPRRRSFGTWRPCVAPSTVQHRSRPPRDQGRTRVGGRTVWDWIPEVDDREMRAMEIRTVDRVLRPLDDDRPRYERRAAQHRRVARTRTAARILGWVVGLPLVLLLIAGLFAIPVFGLSILVLGLMIFPPAHALTARAFLSDLPAGRELSGLH